MWAKDLISSNLTEKNNPNLNNEQLFDIFFQLHVDISQKSLLSQIS
jgi:hypothetical protein